MNTDLNVGSRTAMTYRVVDQISNQDFKKICSRLRRE